MKNIELAYQLRVLFEEKVTSYYRETFRGIYGTVQLEVLEYLYDHSAMRTQSIADKLRIPKQHASKILLRLETDGLVMHSPDPSDRRATIFSLTEKGRAFMDEHMEISNRYYAERFDRLTKQEQEEMLNAMGKVVEILKKF